ncbi:hypothetical protein U9M48_008989 [Paspalum notatum var. saurae]|uniref:Uncharacterized protein n=1 Tax=Paspalum notatum var. saurae TaxID=547442 RepID=A0AAQ3SRU2_PASNO
MRYGSHRYHESKDTKVSRTPGRWGQLRPLPARGRPIRRSAAAGARGAAPRGSGGAALRPGSRSAWGPVAGARRGRAILGVTARRVPTRALVQRWEVEVAWACWPVAAFLVLRRCGHSAPPSSAAVATGRGMECRGGWPAPWP